MGAPAKKKALTPEERRAKRAFTIEEKIKKGCSAIRATWGALASFLHDFQHEELWRDLGHDSFEEWLGTPDIDLGRSQVYDLIACYRELVLEREVDPADLKALEPTKLVQVLPALRREEVELDEAIADCESLSRSDLREKYRKGGGGGRQGKALEKCDMCGKQCVVDDDGPPAVDENQMAIDTAAPTVEDSVVAFVDLSRGATASVIAAELDIKPNRLYRILADLEGLGRLKKKGREYTAVASG